jgi:hypothetical protein
MSIPRVRELNASEMQVWHEQIAHICARRSQLVPLPRRQYVRSDAPFHTRRRRAVV